MQFLRVLAPSVIVLQMCSAVSGQEVISARAGMVHFTEGRVFLDDQQLDRKSGSFPNIKEGSTLRTERGRAEVLLMPGAFLRLDENSSIRMVSTELADTRLVFLSGSMILDLTDARSGNTLSVTYKDSRARFPKKGVYRLDADTGVLQVYSGTAEVTYDGKQTQVDDGHLFFCWLGLETSKLGNGTEDEFYDWASDRNQVISDQNQLAEQTKGDPGDADLSSQLGAGGVPYLGPPGMGSSGGLTGPSLTTPGVPYSAYPYSTYAMGGTLFDPFLTFAATPRFPFGYPVLVVTRPTQTQSHSSQWPHSVNSPVWHPVSLGSSVGSSVFPRPLPGRVVMPGSVGGGYRPAGPRIGVGTAARPSVSVGVHAAGHR